MSFYLKQNYKLFIVSIFILWNLSCGTLSAIEGEPLEDEQTTLSEVVVLKPEEEIFTPILQVHPKSFSYVDNELCGPSGETFMRPLTFEVVAHENESILLSNVEVEASSPLLEINGAALGESVVVKSDDHGQIVLNVNGKKLNSGVNEEKDLISIYVKDTRKEWTYPIRITPPFYYIRNNEMSQYFSSITGTLKVDFHAYETCSRPYIGKLYYQFQRSIGCKYSSSKALKKFNNNVKDFYGRTDSKGHFVKSISNIIQLNIFLFFNEYRLWDENNRKYIYYSSAHKSCKK